VRTDIRYWKEEEIRRKIQEARLRNSPKVWRLLAKELVKQGYREDSGLVVSCKKNAELLEG